MDQLNTAQTIASIVEAMLPRFGSKPRDLWCNPDIPSLALYFHLDMRASYFAEDGEEANGSTNIHFIFERPSNYTKVWICINDNWGKPEPEEFKMLTDHDSCWRSFSSEILHAVINMRDKVLAEVATWDNAPDEKLVRNRMSDFNCIHAIEWVQVTYVKDDTDGRSHNKALTGIKSMKTTEAMALVAQNLTPKE